jgi:hypothetical protein
MRKAFLLSAVAGAALFASTASADVFVFGTVNKTVTVDIEETIVKNKFVFLDVIIRDVPEKFAESYALFNQRNQSNTACENCAEKLDTIAGSINGNVGITSVNQSSGNNNNQGTVIAFSWDLPEDPPGDPPPGGDPGNTGFAHAQTAGSQYMLSNVIDTVNIVFRDAVMTDSVNRNVGITAVNQSAGNINNQANAISVAVSLSNGVALADTALGQFNSGHNVQESNVSKQVFIGTSINGNVGITQVNQAAGNLANQSNTVTIAVTGNF